MAIVMRPIDFAMIEFAEWRVAMENATSK